MTKRSNRKPAPQERIYKSQTGATITTAQCINEILVKYRAEFMGIDAGGEPWKHPGLKEFYQAQFGDISNLLRRFNGRTILDVIQKNRWCCDPRYGGRPMRMKKIIEQLTVECRAFDFEMTERQALPHNHSSDRPSKKREF